MGGGSGCALVPAALRPGDRVRVVAPAGPFDAPLVWRALGWLAERYRVEYSRGIFERRGYLAGPDERRRDELARALGEPGLRAVLVARGGYGTTRVAHQLDWSLLRRDPRWIVGFSDATALHVEAARQGVASLHASNATGLGRGDAHARQALVAALESPGRRRAWSGLRVLRPGRARGVLFGGNLTLLHACAAAGRLVPPSGSIWLIEDVGEAPYRLDRMLTSLAVGGHLAGAAALVVGQLDLGSTEPGSAAAEALLGERLSSLGLPTVVGAPVGHGRCNEPVPLGLPAVLDATGDAGTLSFGAPP